MQRQRVRLVVIGSWLFLLLVWVHQRHYGSATPLSRLDLLHAIVRQGTLEITALRTNTPDVARVGDRYYSDKAPGTAFLALPGFAAAAVVAQSAGVSLDEEAGWRATSWAACVISQAVPATLGAVAILVWLSGFVSWRAALVTTLGLTLGGLTLPYATLLFSHAQVIGLFGIAVWAIGLGQEGAGGAGADGVPGLARRVERGRMVLAGGCVGLALASEFTAGLVALALSGYVAGRRRAGRWWFLAGLVPPLILIPAYSWATLGTPFSLPYSHQASFPEMQEGWYAIKWPDGETAYRLLVGPTRGLVFWTPFLIMAGFGWFWMARERPQWLWWTYAVPVLQVVVISGRTWDWQAGFALGARYLCPILPLLALPCAIGTQRWPRFGAGLALASVAFMTLATVTDACPDYSIHNPLTELHLPKLLRGEFSYTLGSDVLGLHPQLSVAMFYAILIIGWLALRGLGSGVEGEKSASAPAVADPL